MNHMAGAFDDDLMVMANRVVSFLLVRASRLPARRAIDEQHWTFDPT